RIGAAQGLSPADIERIREGPRSAGLTARRAALLEAADDLHEARALGEHAWAALRPVLSDAQLIELCMLIGHYEMLAMTLNRLLTATVTTAALPGPANIRVLLPDGYDANSTRRYPVFYLLHGTSGGASDWTVKGDAERATAGFPAIVVMPDIALNDGGGGWCTDWYNGGAYGPPEWET